MTHSNTPSILKVHQLVEMSSKHVHSLDKEPFHHCEARCQDCNYYCTLPLGHSQAEHDTSHGSMSHTRWVVDEIDTADGILALRDRRFSSNDEGAPMMCSLVCQQLGRHVHVDYCQATEPANCSFPEGEHIKGIVQPHPKRPKDWITHGLHWRRIGFKDPYPRDDQANFGKCDAFCPGPEHTSTTPSQPSFCVLPMFHRSQRLTEPLPAGISGYTSGDGHVFNCRNPILMQQYFHVIFVIDRSSSMGHTDRGPLLNTPVTQRISQHHQNRLGAVYSALHSFWLSRQAYLIGRASRRDTYSVILFNAEATAVMTNNFTSSPDDLLNLVLNYNAGGGTDFRNALLRAQAIMEQHWSGERAPVIIFLSDGECHVQDVIVQDLARTAVRLGKPLSFHAVTFGRHNGSYLLRHMAGIAREIQNNAPTTVGAAGIESSFLQALDTIQLNEGFLHISESMRKTRGALLH